LVSSLALPGGEYLVNGYVNANNDSSTNRNARCRVTLGGVEIGNRGFVTLESNVGLDKQDLSVSTADTLPAPGALLMLRSEDGATPSGNWLSRGLTAIQVDSLNGA
jgi:hypothetical protein